MPADQVLPRQRVMFQTLLGLLVREDIEATAKMPIVYNIFRFILDKEYINLAIKWLDTSYIFIGHGKKHPLFEIQKKHKFSIIKAIFRNVDIPKN
jgi:hypothetical protein